MSVWIIKWGESFSESYAFGAKVKKEPNSVYYSASMMPVASKIRTWKAIGSFAVDRTSPALPLLLAGEEYHIKALLEADDNASFELRVDCYDRFGNLIEMFSNDGLELTFTYPNETVNYEVALVNKRHKYLYFNYLLISDKENIDAVKLGPSAGLLKADDEPTYTIDYLWRQTNIVKRPTGLGLMVQPDIKSLVSGLELMSEVIQKDAAESETGAKKLRILKGINFEKLPEAFHLIPTLLEKINPGLELDTDIIPDNLSSLGNILKAYTDRNKEHA
ncbi:accessory Sec system protein Asp3 [Lactococcus termiticola]|uniref:Accessory Sec system protein Asp3 n=1 Tax=Lactococcus termiticola TaxID=2169526 RepID=A0A2R5HE44_9LACT|nr:accessory Sec system protein Asp3 [Lactococcus termiticola]GBG96357.1 hypothetical protein NtB2_00468 [Lactococcus termiticola]